MADWDESNAFGNVSRSFLSHLLMDYPGLDCGEWIDWFFTSLRIYLQTPFGLAEGYRFLQGGTQVDSMGVGAYMVLRAVRSRALRGACPGIPHPGMPGEEFQDVIFSDDGRLFGLLEACLAAIMNMCVDLAVWSGGTVNLDKLKLFHIALREGRLALLKGAMALCLGEVSYSMSGLKMVGVPALMGASLTDILDSVKAKLIRVASKIKYLRPSPMLSLRIVLAFAVSSLDYKLTVVPVYEEELEPLQVQVRQAARAALALPRWFSDVYLTAPFSRGGMGFPLLALRLRLKRILVMTGVLTGRAVYPRALVSATLRDPIWAGLPGSDPLVLKDDTEKLGLELCLDPSNELVTSVVHGGWLRDRVGQSIAVASDGSLDGHKLGFAAVFLDPVGAFGSFWATVEVQDTTPWAAEWFGKFLGVRKLPECDPQAEASLALVADAQSTVLGETDLRTSGSHLIDQVMLSVASVVVARRGTEIYLPAQHDSRWKTGLPKRSAAHMTSLALPPSSLLLEPCRSWRA